MENVKWKLTLLSLAGIFPFIINGYINSLIHTHVLAYWAFDLFCWIILPLIVLTLSYHLCHLRFNDIGIHTNIRGQYRPALLIIACLAFGPVELWLYRESLALGKLFLSDNTVFTYKTVMPKNAILNAIVAVYFGLSAGIIEEIYYRGILYRVAEHFKHSSVLYLGLSPLIFSSIHWELGMASMFAAYVFGLFATLAYFYMRNLLPVITGHIYLDYNWFS